MHSTRALRGYSGKGGSWPAVQVAMCSFAPRPRPNSGRKRQACPTGTALGAIGPRSSMIVSAITASVIERVRCGGCSPMSTRVCSPPRNARRWSCPSISEGTPTTRMCSQPHRPWKGVSTSATFPPRCCARFHPLWRATCNASAEPARSTGTALVLSIVNQRPHDLFFFARPADLLDGEVEPPGCWLDASAVLVRQYLAYCFDQGVSAGILTDLPATGKQLVDEVIINKTGHIPGLIAWMMVNEAQLQQDFLARFFADVLPDTVVRFTEDTRTEQLRERIERAAQEFNSQRLLLQNARKRLTDQKNKLDPQTDPEAVAEIEREQKILSARTRKLGEISALEVLIEHGLLPNYAFPERGVRFSGTTYNQYANQTAPGAGKEDASEGKGGRRSGSGEDL